MDPGQTFGQTHGEGPVPNKSPDSLQSESTRVLAQLLGDWRRRDVAAALFAEVSQEVAQEESLLGGEVRAILSAQGAGIRRKTPLAFPADPAVGWFDAAYPEQLRHIPDPPLLLYTRGPQHVLAQSMVAIVGARRCSAPGRQFAEDLGHDLSRAGLVVLSGMALGIDGAAHRGALSAGGCTVAVLGSGLMQLYPSRHVPLAKNILRAGGVLVSEYPGATPPNAWQFPERNRLVSGLSLATIVVEAGERSGSLITARLALEQGRDVFAVPGPVGSAVSGGCHRLIQQGAALITSVSDVLEELGWSVPDSACHSGADAQVPAAYPEPGYRADILSENARTLLGIFHGRLRSLDELLLRSGLLPQVVSSELASLELQGFVRRERDGYIATSKILKQEK